MATTVKITEAELLDALAAAIKQSNAPAEAKTTQDLMAETGLSIRAVTRALKQYAAQGRLSVFRVPRPQIDGSTRCVPGYTISPKPRKARG